MKKNKVLYIGHYLEQSAWSRAYIGYARAMREIGFDVVARPIKLGLPCPALDDDILEMENKSSSGCEFVVHHTLPHHYSYDSRFKKNICFYPTESTNFTDCGWQHYINLMDSGVVFARDSINSSRVSGVTIPLSYVPHAVDVTRYKVPRKKIDFGNDDFKFLWVGDHSTRKNLTAVLRAFHSTFDPSEPVSLIIKINSFNTTESQLLKEVDNVTEKIKTDLRIYPNNKYYKPEIIIPDYIDSDAMLDLYNSVDCYVSTSMGEGWGFNITDAIGMQKMCIGVNYGGVKEQLKFTQLGYLVNYTESPCTGEHNTFNGLFTGHSNWCSVDIQDLMNKMRLVYKNRNDDYYQRECRQLRREEIEEYSYESVGRKLQGIIQ